MLFIVLGEVVNKLDRFNQSFLDIIYKGVKKVKKHRFAIFFAIYTIGYLFYVFAFHIGWIRAFYDTAALFAFDIRIGYEHIDTWFKSLIYIIALIAGSYTLLSVIAPFFKHKKDDIKKQRVLKSKKIIVIGLSYSTKAYLDSIDDIENESILVLAQDKNDTYLQKYEHSSNVAIENIAFLYQDIDSLNLSEVKHIIISTDSDMDNLEIATKLISTNDKLKIFVQVEDRNLRYLHKENGLLSSQNIRIYSHNEESVRLLFDRYDIDGIYNDVIDSCNPFAIAVVGNTSLSYEIVSQCTILGQLPNENPLTIYCIDKDKQAFQDAIELHFPQIDKVPNLTLEFVELNHSKKAFYNNTIWDRTLSYVVLCLENEQTNLDIASMLLEFTFIEKIVHKQMNTQILMAMPNGYKLGEKIKHNMEFLKYLDTFASTIDISNDKYIVAEDRDKKAIATDFLYSNIDIKVDNYARYEYIYTFKTDNEDEKKEYEKSGYIRINDSNWNKLYYLHKESNRMVADHIKVKLKFLGLVSKKVKNIDTKELFFDNKKLFESKLEDKVKLAKAEHNRWNAFHYIHGYEQIPFVSKTQKSFLKTQHNTLKKHMCLVDFDEFKARADELDALGYNKGEFEGYDIAINDHIPLILAYAGYKIYQNVTVGITGHRSGISDEVYTKLFRYIKDMIEKESISIKTIISPLADGADRVVAKHILEEHNAKLIVPLPFKEYEYQKDFSKDSKKEFEKLIAKADRVYTISDIDKISKDEAYLKAGEYVVNNCDILIAIWDGEDARGVGGTADIVEYAKKCKKPTLYINTENLNIKYINFNGEK